MTETPPSEHQRIVDAYARRSARRDTAFFGYESPAHLYRVQERARQTLRLLDQHGFQPVGEKRLLDVGCGHGRTLRATIDWGCTPSQVCGVELRKDAVAMCHQLSPEIEVHCQSATDLPWPRHHFDLVVLETVFSSILKSELRRTIAEEIDRVLRPGGAIIWYDLRFNNPRNPDVQGISRRTLNKLFHEYQFDIRPLTLLPPLARRLPNRLLPFLGPWLALLPGLRTHLHGLLCKPTDR